MPLYHRAHSVADAVAHHTAVENSAYLAGGQTLIAALNRRELHCGLIVDIADLAELRDIVSDERGLRIGAAATLNEILSNPMALRALPILKQVLPCVANHTIRNRSTLGGHVALADGLSEVNLLLHAAQAVIVTSQRETTMDLLQPAHRVAALDANELITAVIIPRETLRSAYGFCEFTLRPSGGRAIVAAVIRCDAGEPARAVVAGLTVTPIVLHAEQIVDPRMSFEQALARDEDIEPVARWPQAYRLQLGLEALERAQATPAAGTNP